MAKSLAEPMAESMAEEISLIFGAGKLAFDARYKVIREIGKGCTSKVYEGIRLSDNLRVALKYVSKFGDGCCDSECSLITTEEVRVLHKLKNVPGIIKLYDYYYFNEHLVIVLQKPAKCADLEKFILKEGKISEDLARSLFSDIVGAVIGCYEKRVLHNDLEISNILIDLDNFKAMIIGFGDARFLQPHEIVRRHVPGSLQKPESNVQEFYYREKVSVKKVAQILYHMLTGDASHKWKFLACSEGIFMARPDISQKCKHLVSRCLFAEESKRPTLQQMLVFPWMLQSNDE